MAAAGARDLLIAALRQVFELPTFSNRSAPWRPSERKIMAASSRFVSPVLVWSLLAVASAACGSETPGDPPPANLSPFGGSAGQGVAGTPTAPTTAGNGGSSSGAGGTGGAPTNLCTSVPPGKMALLDDFEDHDPIAKRELARDAFWFTGHDDSAGSIMPDGELVPETGGPHGSAYAAHVVASGYSTWGANVALAMSYKTGELRCPFNASAFKGIRFEARGKGVVRVQVPVPETVDKEFGGSCDPAKAMVCYDQHGVDITLSEEWQSYELPWSEFSQFGWGTPATLEPKSIMGLGWVFNPANLPVDLWFDNVTFWDGVHVPDMGKGGAAGAAGAGAGGAGGAEEPIGGGAGGESQD
jgi:hypothetical protein